MGIDRIPNRTILQTAGRYFRRPTPPFRAHEDTFAYLIRFYSIRVAHAIAAWKRF